MNNIVNLINTYDVDLIGPTSVENIEKAQDLLKFKFSDEYKEYLLKFGIIAYASQELCGLGVDGYLNVVTTTLEERSLNSSLINFVVIQNNGEYLITLNENNEVFESTRLGNKKIYDSFYRFLEKEFLVN